MKTHFEDRDHIFRAHPHYNSSQRYDWAYVEYADESRTKSAVPITAKEYAALILGFIWFTGDKDVSTVVCTSTKSIPWEKRMRDFVSHFELGTDFAKEYNTIPICSILNPLFVIQEYGNANN